jgi:hypothetical protein
MTTSPFRTNPTLGPDLFQIVTPGSVWYDNPNMVSPKVGTRETGNDGYDYIFVKASGVIAAAASPGTQVAITEPAMTAATGSGGFYAPVAGVASGSYFWARKGAAV